MTDQAMLDLAVGIATRLTDLVQTQASALSGLTISSRLVDFPALPLSASIDGGTLSITSTSYAFFGVTVSDTVHGSPSTFIAVPARDLDFLTLTYDPSETFTQSIWAGTKTLAVELDEVSWRSNVKTAVGIPIQGLLIALGLDFSFIETVILNVSLKVSNYAVSEFRNGNSKPLVSEVIQALQSAVVETVGEAAAKLFLGVSPIWKLMQAANLAASSAPFFVDYGRLFLATGDSAQRYICSDSGGREWPCGTFDQLWFPIPSATVEGYVELDPRYGWVLRCDYDLSFWVQTGETFSTTLADVMETGAYWTATNSICPLAPFGSPPCPDEWVVGGMGDGAVFTALYTITDPHGNVVPTAFTDTIRYHYKLGSMLSTSGAEVTWTTPTFTCLPPTCGKPGTVCCGSSGPLVANNVCCPDGTQGWRCCGSTVLWVENQCCSDGTQAPTCSPSPAP